MTPKGPRGVIVGLAAALLVIVTAVGAHASTIAVPPPVDPGVPPGVTPVPPPVDPGVPPGVTPVPPPVDPGVPPGVTPVPPPVDPGVPPGVTPVPPPVDPGVPPGVTPVPPPVDPGVTPVPVTDPGFAPAAPPCVPPSSTGTDLGTTPSPAVSGTPVLSTLNPPFLGSAPPCLPVIVPRSAPTGPVDDGPTITAGPTPSGFGGEETDALTPVVPPAEVVTTVDVVTPVDVVTLAPDADLTVTPRSSGAVVQQLGPEFLAAAPPGAPSSGSGAVANAPPVVAIDGHVAVPAGTQGSVAAWSLGLVAAGVALLTAFLLARRRGRPRTG